MQEVGLLVAQQVHEDLAPHLLGERDLHGGRGELAGMVVGRGLLDLLPDEVLALGGEPDVTDGSHHRALVLGPRPDLRRGSSERRLYNTRLWGEGNLGQY